MPQDERDARVLARWIAETGPARINVSAIRDDARLSGLRDTLRVKGACRFLEEAGWVTAPPRERKSGRPPNDYEVNPQLWDMLPARSPSP